MDFCRACATRNRLFWLIYMQNGALCAPHPEKTPRKSQFEKKNPRKIHKKSNPPCSSSVRWSVPQYSKYSKTTANAVSHSSPGNVSVNTKRKHVKGSDQ
jgi:hypothetical protein